MIEFDVYQWVRDCPNCGAPTPVVSADDPNSHSILKNDLIGEELAELEFSFVEQGKKPGDNEAYANICIECREYLDIMVRSEMLSEIYTSEPRTTMKITPSCEHCEENEANRLEQGRPLCELCTMRDLFETQK